MAFEPFTKDEQPTMANFNNKLKEAIGDAVSQAADFIQIGEYQGTGTLGKDGATTITFDSPPKIVILLGQGTSAVYGGANGILLIRGVTTSFMTGSGSSSYTNTIVVFDEHKLTWYSTISSDNQWNKAGTTYRFLAIA